MGDTDLIDTGPTTLRRTEVHISVWIFVGSTLLIWLTRVRNVLTDDSLSGPDVARSLVLPVLFLFIAMAVGVIALSGPERGTFGSAMLVVATSVTVIWAVRAVMIALGDHAAGFISVHVVLAVVSVGVVWWAAKRSNGEVSDGVG